MIPVFRKQKQNGVHVVLLDGLMPYRARDPEPGMSTCKRFIDKAVPLAVVVLILVNLVAVIYYPTDTDDPLEETSADPSRVHFQMTESKQLKPLPSLGRQFKTDVVMFVPSPIPWEERRQYVYNQFVKEGWTPSQVVLLFIFGSHTIETKMNVSLTNRPPATNVFVPCRDFGDEPDSTDDTSSTTCKVYEAIRHIVSHYRAKYVWRGADDSYVNLRYFFVHLMPALPTSRLYFGRLRTARMINDDLRLSNQPHLSSLFGLYQFGQYMVGSGYLLSYDVADFIASLKIPPHLTWCEDVMVGMWLNPFQITFMHSSQFVDQPDRRAALGVDYVLIHRMRPDQWARIDDNGRLF